jgi:hypothetical protein
MKHKAEERAPTDGSVLGTRRVREFLDVTSAHAPGVLGQISCRCGTKMTMKRLPSLSLVWMSLALAMVVGLGACSSRGPRDGGDDGQDGAGEGEGELGEGEGELGEGEGEGEEGLPPIFLSEVSCRGGDWVEVKNDGETEQPLAMFSVTDDVSDPQRRQVLSGVLGPSERAVFDIDAFGIACTETLTLLAGNRVIDATTLAVARPGATWARLPEPVTPSSPFAEALPTRGEPNLLFALGAVRVNEVDCRGTDRVEIVNAGEESVDVGGFVLATDPLDPAQRYTLPARNLPVGGRLVLREVDPTVVPRADGFPFDIGCTQSLVLIDAAGQTVDAVAPERTAEAFTWGRMPDVTGDFVATEETLGEPNVAAALLAADVFVDDAVATVEVEVAPSDAPRLLDELDAKVDCLFWYEDEPAVPCVVRQERALRFVVDFVDGERFSGLDSVVVDGSTSDPTRLRALVASAAFAASTVVAPRAALALASVAGAPSTLVNLVEVLDGRRLSREMASTGHVYESGPGPLDLVGSDVDRWRVVEGDPADVDDLRRVASTLSDLRTEPGIVTDAAAVLALQSTLRFLAVDAWLSHTDGYAAARGDVVVHVDEDGEATLMPGDLDRILESNGDLFSAGSVLVDACLVDPACTTLYTATLADVDAALALAGLGDRLAAHATLARPFVADTSAFDAAVDDVRARLEARSDEVQAQLDDFGG